MAKPKRPDPTIARAKAQRHHYAALWVAANQALTLLRSMEEAGAIRLPFNGYQQTVDTLRQAVAIPENR